MKLPVHRIIPFSNVEGMGNRTSIFVQGCNVNCVYCHNSETIPKEYDHVTFYTVEELLTLLKGNMPFIRGITVSGGEATLYHSFLKELFEEVKALGLTCYVDSNGFYDSKVIEKLIDVTDKFLFDIKGFGQSLTSLCFSNDFLPQGTQVSVDKVTFTESHTQFENLKGLLEKDKVEEVRLVYIKGYYDERDLVKRISDLLKPYPTVLFKLIKVHGKGLPLERAKNLKGRVPSKEEFDALCDYSRAVGINTLITIG